ncbi:hypothetical protein NKI96_10760 [Mesorhizobium sp. M0292]|uniref:hypothetical protein n=1 Tax=Mesorhizobium sp. M0292 TaxID=2956929 RepID=UPI003334BBEF
MTRTNIAAFTATNYEGHYPPYISINKEDGLVEIMIRSPEKNGVEGTLAAIKLSEDEFAGLDLVRVPPVTRDTQRSEFALVPQGGPVALGECPEGLFLFGDTLAVMTEYATDASVRQRDAYIVDSGEYFWGGTSQAADRAKLIVQPLTHVSVKP